MVDFYYHTWMVMTQENPLKVDKIQKLNLHEALYYLSYIVKKNRELDAKMKKQKK